MSLVLLFFINSKFVLGMDKWGSSHIGMVKQSCHLSDAEPCKDTKLSLKAGSFLCRVELLEEICLLIKEKENTTGGKGEGSSRERKEHRLRVKPVLQFKHCML